MNLSDNIIRFPFVGPTYAKRLEKLGIHTIEDLIFHFPFRYDDFSLISPIVKLQIGETVTITGVLEKITNTFTKTGKRIQEAIIDDGTGKVEAVWFNQIYLVKTFKKGETYNFSGKVDWFGHKKVLLSPEYEINKNNELRIKNYGLENIHTGRLVPVYPETYDVSSKWLRSRIKTALNSLSGQLEEFLPQDLIEKEGLLPENKAILEMHFPSNKPLAEKARYRLAFDELFLIQLSALIRKKDWLGKTLAKQFFIDLEKSMAFVENLPFKLTNAQKRCIKEILLDLQKTTPMNRLLQGDVGSGKTVVAALSAYTAFLNQSQTLFMAPTEILANQHYSTLKSLLEPLGVPIELITGSRKPDYRLRTTDYGEDKKNKENKITRYQDSNITIPKVIVGTHALLYQDFDPGKVGLVIVDEQHRFGVEQRKLIAEKGKSPHFLTMTATPIPRTIALTLYNDLDLSIINEMPSGRIEVKTWVVPNEKRKKAYDWIRNRVKNTEEQAFIICPLIEESESLTTVKAVKKEYENLSKNVFPDLKIALLHGKIKSKEKEKILSDFREGKFDILVATPVVEVGIDIPNATIMLVEGADRFGLAQLHQLRGRVGRSNKQSFCLLFTENENKQVLERLNYLEKTNSGLELAEADLKLRGPGEVYGTKQHGFPDLKIASFSDLELIQKTRSAASEILTTNYLLLTTNDSPLKQRLEKYKIKATSAN